ncbi:hypothetical protein DYH09_18880 [bacterium CPR1]|nr:hypothetical protein [bacterium CPR1]
MLEPGGRFVVMASPVAIGKLAELLARLGILPSAMQGRAKRFPGPSAATPLSALRQHQAGFIPPTLRRERPGQPVQVEKVALSFRIARVDEPPAWRQSMIVQLAGLPIGSFSTLPAVVSSQELSFQPPELAIPGPQPLGSAQVSACGLRAFGFDFRGLRELSLDLICLDRHNLVDLDRELTQIASCQTQDFRVSLLLDQASRSAHGSSEGQYAKADRIELFTTLNLSGSSGSPRLTGHLIDRAPRRGCRSQHRTGGTYAGLRIQPVATLALDELQEFLAQTVPVDSNLGESNLDVTLQAAPILEASLQFQYSFESLHDQLADASCALTVAVQQEKLSADLSQKHPECVV